ncbi:carbonic anhydrase-related protein 10 [Aplysia californica]|uniref:Carbonic anhydrase-related protein 10 n=1 Tax=Aplysia californica TaxID=6500 RepID=A0ABM1ABE4_APLCA|nr:carbonic anhydrase-related protein 10 [Aplysia californica]
MKYYYCSMNTIHRLAEVKIHIGKVNNRGSEHLIDGKAFGAELQFICYNSDLFSSMAASQHVPYGVAIVAVLAEATRSEKEANSAFTILTNVAKRIPWQGNAVRVPNFNLAALVPETNYYVTYEGSFTQPACLETVTWLILNRPILIQASQLDTLRQLQKEQADTRMKMSNGNSRPVSPLYNRAVRTNINFPTTGGLCNMKRIFYYEVNDVVR